MYILCMATQFYQQRKQTQVPGASENYLVTLEDSTTGVAV